MLSAAPELPQVTAAAQQGKAAGRAWDVGVRESQRCWGYSRAGELKLGP